MITRKACPDCGATACAEPEVGLPDFACRCGWEEGGPGDFGFVGMKDREFCPVPGEPELMETVIAPSGIEIVLWPWRRRNAA